MLFDLVSTPFFPREPNMTIMSQDRMNAFSDHNLKEKSGDGVDYAMLT